MKLAHLSPLVGAAIVGACVVATPTPVRAATCPQAYSWTQGETITATKLNANPAALSACFNNIDSSNIGTNGLWASQIKPTSVAQAVFGGSQPYSFPSGVQSTSFTSTSAVGAYDFIFPSSGASGKTGLFGGTGSSPKVMGIAPSLLGVDDTNRASLLALDTAGNLGVPAVFTGPVSATSGTFSQGVTAANLSAPSGTVTAAQVTTNGETVNGTATIGNIAMIGQAYYNNRGGIPYLAGSGNAVPHIEAGYVVGNNSATGVVKNFLNSFVGNPICTVSYQYAGLLATTTPQATFNVNVAGIVIYGYTLPIAYNCVGS